MAAISNLFFASSLEQKDQLTRYLAGTIRVTCKKKKNKIKKKIKLSLRKSKMAAMGQS